MDDLEPSAWFKERWSAWQKAVSDWKKRQSEAREAARRKPLAKKEEKKEPPPEKEKKDGDKEGEDGEKDGDKAKEESKSEPVEIDEESLDVFTIENLDDIGNGKPIYSHFVYEDWTLLSLRYELHLLVYAFRHDVNDPDRPGFHEMHLPFYYSRYFGKPFSVKYFGVQSISELC